MVDDYKNVTRPLVWVGFPPFLCPRFGSQFPHRFRCQYCKLARKASTSTFTYPLNTADIALSLT